VVLRERDLVLVARVEDISACRPADCVSVRVHLEQVLSLAPRQALDCFLLDRQVKLIRRECSELTVGIFDAILCVEVEPNCQLVGRHLSEVSVGPNL
jgi:hypothetical protein